MPDEAHAKQVGDEMRVLYSTAVTEIAGFKRQVWHVTNYAVLLSRFQKVLSQIPPNARLIATCEFHYGLHKTHSFPKTLSSPALEPQPARVSSRYRSLQSD